VPIPSVQSGGAHGHLALTTTAAAYLTFAGVAFVAPTHSGPAPVHGDAPTGPKITETNRQYDAELKEYMMYLAVEVNLERLLVQAILGVYIEELNHDVLGLATTTTLVILTHLDPPMVPLLPMISTRT
jgi:hypothetical protein